MTPKKGAEVDVALLGKGRDDDGGDASSDDMGGADFDSAASDAWDAYMDKDEESWKSALRNAIEAVLDERGA